MAKVPPDVQAEDQDLVQAFERLLAQIQTQTATALADGAAVDYSQIEQQVAQQIATLRQKAQASLLGAVGAAASRKETP